MGELKHTPGPWLVNSSAVKARWPFDTITICEANLISVVDGKKAPREQQIANLFLMAAAPEMKDGLNFCISVIEANGVYEASERLAIEKAKAALRSANQ